MLRIAVVDDEYAVAVQTERCWLEACKTLELETETELLCSGEEMIHALKKENQYKILFLDIEMGECSGIDVSRFLRDTLQDEATQIVFVTGKEGYDRQLFEFRPFAFLPKPVNTEKIREILSKYLRIFGKKQETFEYKIGHSTNLVKIEDILYFESFDRKVQITTAKNADEFYGSIQKISKQLSNKGFFMPHKSYLVNYRFVKSIRPDSLLLANDVLIPIAKGKHKDITRLLFEMEYGDEI